MNIDALVENFYNKIDVNEDLINEVLKFLLVEADAGLPPKATFDWSMIPDIPISEIGWGDVSTVTDEEGKTQTVLGPQRALLQQYLDNIGSPSNTFQEQIKSLEKFYGPTGPADIMAAAETNADAISKLISYLVFYKTLTKVVTNFNAASAGFTFEAFLATLLHGVQIPPNTGTIADFTTGDMVPISLKLYAEKSLKVGGSYRDLVRDLGTPNSKFNHPAEGGSGMRYVVCTKDITGKDLKQKGGIKFYQFDFTLDNVFNILASSMDKSQKNIWLPAAYVAAVKKGGTLDFNSTLPSVAMHSPEDMEKMFIANLKELSKPEVGSVTVGKTTTEFTARPEALDPSFPSEEEMQYILQEIDYAKKDDYFNAIKIPAADEEEKDTKEVVRGISQLKKRALQGLVRNAYIANHANSPDRDTKKVPAGAWFGFLSGRLWAANQMIVGSLKAAEMKLKRTEALKETQWVTDMDDLKVFYKGLPFEEKKQALLNSYGFLNEEQFDLNRAQATEKGAPIFSEYLGTILIGGQIVEDMLKNVAALLNDEIYSVFASLKTLSDNLNGFFAGGLSNDELAGTAIDSAKDIEKKTTKLKKSEK
jgi:hypothetical protein